MLLGTAVYDCQQGKDRNTALKMRNKKEKEKVKHAYTNRLIMMAKVDKYLFICVFKKIFICLFVFSVAIRRSWGRNKEI